MIAEVAEIARKAKAERVSMLAVMKSAKVSYTTWTRWRGEDVTPNLGTLYKVRQALDDLIAERSA